MAAHVDIRIATNDFAMAEEYARMRERQGGRSGAIASFVGLVRDRTEDQAVGTLHLEHYPGMTERSMAAIVDQVSSRWPLDDVVVIHRVGALAATEQIVLVLVASAHRAAAFAACMYIMDYLKTDAVLWKRESSAEGSRWIEATTEDRARVLAWSAPPAEQ